MDNTLKQYTIKGIISTLIASALFHFIYGWLNKHWIAAVFTPINNSIWEYLKLIFVPMTLYSIIEHKLIGEKYPRLMPARIYGMFAGIIIILFMLCAYTGIFGKRYFVLNIIAVTGGIAAAFLISHRIQLKYRLSRVACERSIIFLTAFTVCIIAFTIYQPKLALFHVYKPPSS